MRTSIKVGIAAAALGTIAVATPLGAQAASLITSAQIKDQTIQSRDIGSQAVASSEIRNQSITSGDIAPSGVGASEVRNGSLTGSDINAATVKRFLTGETAIKENDTQDAKISGLADRVTAEENKADKVGLHNVRAGAGYTTVAAPGMSVVFNQCDVPGQVAISGGYRLNGHAAESFSPGGGAAVEGLTVIASEPAAAKGGELVNAYKDDTFPQTEDGAFEANAWAVTINNTTGEPKDVRVWATCASL